MGKDNKNKNKGKGNVAQGQGKSQRRQNKKEEDLLFTMAQSQNEIISKLTETPTDTYCVLFAIGVVTTSMPAAVGLYYTGQSLTELFFLPLLVGISASGICLGYSYDAIACSVRHAVTEDTYKSALLAGSDDVDELKLLESQKKKQVEGAIWESSTYSIAVVNAQYILLFLISNLLVFPRTAYPVYISYVLSTSVAVAVVLLGIKFPASVHGDLDNHFKESQKSRFD